jgi:hypothetical protein
MSVHIYIIDEWRWIPILFNLWKVIDRAIVDNLTLLIVYSLVDYGGLSEIDIANKLVCFEIDKVTIFRNVKNRVMT